GNLLLRWTYGARFSDLSPFRAIRRDTLERFGMCDLTYGWNLEMLMRVAAANLRAREVPVGQRRRRGGQSKVSGNVIAGIKAACVMGAKFVRLSMHLRNERRRGTAGLIPPSSELHLRSFSLSDIQDVPAQPGIKSKTAAGALDEPSRIPRR